MAKGKLSKIADREDLRGYSRKGRFYILPDGGDQDKFPSVTSIISAGVPKPALMGWAGKYAAEFAVDNYDLVGDMLENDGTQGAVDWIKGASRRYTAKAGKEGSAVHDFAEAYFMGQDPSPDDFSVSPRTDEMIDQIIGFVHAIKPRFLHVEPLLYSKEHKYAGAADMIVKVKNPELLNLMRWKKKRQPVLILDIKTSKSGVYPEAALQMSAYANADTLLTMDGQEHEVPRIDLAAVIHIRENSWTLTPVDIGPPVFAAFLAAMDVAKWEWETSKGTVGNPIARGSFE